MSQILSQDEVDALLSGITEGEVETETKALHAAQGGGVASFDFANQDRIIRGRLPTLEMIHDRFARLHRTSISGVLRRAIDVSILSTEMIKFGEFIRAIPLPTSLHVLKMDPLKGFIIVVMDGRLIFSLVDIFFGGKGTNYFKIEGRDFTPIENKLIKKVTELVMHDYQEAWQPVHPINVQYVRSEVNPQFVSVVPTSDVVIAIVCEIEIEESSGKMTFCIPYSTIESIKDKLKTGFQTESFELDKTWIERIKVHIKEAKVDVRSVLGSATINGKDLINMKIGDVIQLNEDINHPADIYIEGIKKFKGYAGGYRGNKAIQISEVFEPKAVI